MAECNNLPKELASMHGAIRDIFPQDQVVSSFVCGSTVEQRSSTSDIDVFICCQGEITESQRYDWTEYYLDLHELLGREPDVVSPGELMSTDTLRYGLDRVATIEPAVNLRNRYDFDYLCWAGMIDSRRIDIIRTDKFITFEKLAQDGVARWVKALVGGRATTHKTGKNTDADKILARTISCKGYYDAHE